MVLLQVKCWDGQHFLFETPLASPVGETITELLAIHTLLAEIKGLLNAAETLARGPEGSPPTDGPLTGALAAASAAVSPDHIKQRWPLSHKTLEAHAGSLKSALLERHPEAAWEALLPPAAGPEGATLCFASRTLAADAPLSRALGRNERTLAIVTLQASGPAATAAAPREADSSGSGSEEWMAWAHRRQEERKRLEADDEDGYLDAPWADRLALKRHFQGLPSTVRTTTWGLTD